MMQEFVQEIKNIIDKNIRGIHTAIPGKIISFDPSTCLATVLPTMKFKKPDGSTMAYPQITGVPVVLLQTMYQQATVAFPIKAGDGCLIIVSEQSIDYWMYGQETDTDLAFDLTNAICIPGLFVEPNPVVREACAQGAIIIDVKGTRIKVKDKLVQVDSEKVVINGNVEINGTVTTGS